MINARDVQPVEVATATHTRLKKVADERGMKLGALATTAVNEWLDEQDRKAEVEEPGGTLDETA